MGFLTYLFLPLTGAYALKSEFFDRLWRLGVAGFGLLSDFDEFLGILGLFQSTVLLILIIVIIVGVSVASALLSGTVLVGDWWRTRNRLQNTEAKQN